MKGYQDKVRGIFIRNDINGNPVYVGDKVKVSKGEAFVSGTEEDGFYVRPEEFIGILTLTFSRGLALNTHGGYVNVKTTDRGFRKQTWLKID